MLRSALGLLPQPAQPIRLRYYERFRNRQECFRYGRMLFRQSLKSRADTVALIDFAQDRCKRHGQTAFAEKPKVEELQMDWLRSEDLKEEKDVTAPTFIVAGTSDHN